MAAKSLGAESAPSNVIPFPVRKPEPSPWESFHRAHCEFEVARAERELAWARSSLARWNGENTAGGQWRDATDATLEAMKVALLKFLAQPCPKKCHLVLKRRAIGPSWMKAEGEFYDALRAMLAADEARLAAGA